MRDRTAPHLFRNRPTPQATGFSKVRREHTDLHWKIEAREQKIFRAAGFSD